MNIKETFLKLTQYTVPHGKEDTLKKYLPSGVKRDNFGNYSLTIGNSETLFTCHLDTVSTKVEKVNHIISGNIIKTDGTTILGGDNKVGVCILLYMIEHNIPGTYYFFAGEEPTAKGGGLYGSKNALRANPEYFKKFKRAVCFDRKHEGSIVIRQMARFTCSDDFVTALQKEFSRFNLEFHPDQTGWYTDTAVFIDVIPEVTNLSAGVYKEHTVNEYVDISYVEKVANAAIRINWENLPTVRIAKKETTLDSDKRKNSIFNFKSFRNKKLDKSIFDTIYGYLENANFLCLNPDEYDSGVNIIFSKWHEDVRILIKVENEIVFFNNKKIGTLKDFEKFANIGFEQKVDIEQFIGFIYKVAENIKKDIINNQIFVKILSKFNVTIEDFEEYYNSDDYQLEDYIEYDENEKEVKLSS